MHPVQTATKHLRWLSTGLPRAANSLTLSSAPTSSLLSSSLSRALSTTSSISHSNRAPGAKPDKLLFTPGPLLTSAGVKAAMQHDLGSRDVAFITVIREVRQELLRHAGVSPSEFTVIPIQGSGTFGVEAVMSSVMRRDRKVLIVANGAYGLRMQKMAQVMGQAHQLLSYPDNVAVSLPDIDRALKADPEISHVAVVHSETTSGIVNDINAVGQLVKSHNRTFIVDAMSSFGGIPIDFAAGNISYLVSSANKCIQGSPGFAFIIANKKALEQDKGNARSLSLDIHSQNEGLDKDGQFRFTPPTHSLLAFRQALRELDEEGGVVARNKRYWENYRVVGEGFKKLGFKKYLKDELQGPIITSFLYPQHANWSFQNFYKELNELDLVIYPGKVSAADCFRIGHIGHLFPEHSQKLVDGVAQVLKKMKITL